MFFKPLLPLGSLAPNFSLLDDTGHTVELSSFRGLKKVVLIFYPADNTPGCTAQLCEFRDKAAQWVSEGVEVFGLNPGDWEKHHQFAQKHQFGFKILFDPRAKMAQKYHSMLISPFLPRRTVYGIDLEGKIVYAKRGKPVVEEVLKALTSC